MNNSDPLISLAERARKAYTANDFILSADLFGQAVDGYADRGDQRQAAEMRNNRSVALLRAGKPEAALEAVAGTAELFEQASDTKMQAMALGNQAAALEDLHRLEEAMTDYRHAADLFKNLGETEMRAVILKRISTIQIQRKKPVEALFSMDAAVETSQQLSWSDRILRRLMAFIKKRAGLT